MVPLDDEYDQHFEPIGEYDQNYAPLDQHFEPIGRDYVPIGEYNEELDQRCSDLLEEKLVTLRGPRAGKEEAISAAIHELNEIKFLDDSFSFESWKTW